MGKFIEKTKKLFEYFKGGFERFRVTIIFALISFILVVLITEIGDLDFKRFYVAVLEEVRNCCILGIFMTAMFEVVREEYFGEKKNGLLEAFIQF